MGFPVAGGVHRAPILDGLVVVILYSYSPTPSPSCLLLLRHRPTRSRSRKVWVYLYSGFDFDFYNPSLKLEGGPHAKLRSVTKDKRQKKGNIKGKSKRCNSRFLFLSHPSPSRCRIPYEDRLFTYVSHFKSQGLVDGYIASSPTFYFLLMSSNVPRLSSVFCYTSVAAPPARSALVVPTPSSHVCAPWCRRLAVRPGVVSFRPVWFSVCGSVSLSSLGPRTVASRVYLGPKKLSLSLSLPLAR